MASEGSKIFVGHRALGYVSNHVPLVTRYIHRRREHLVVTCVGRVFHTYGCAKLGLLSVSKIHPEDITCMTADAYLVFAAAGKDIYAWRRGSELKHLYRGHEAPVRLMIPFGPHLISVDSASVLKIWDIKSEHLAVELEFSPKSFAISSIVHPATYINKILLGSHQGSLQLWNIKSQKLIHRFSGWDSPVLCLEQAPAIDVVAIGLKSGDIYVHNIKFDETIVKFSQDWGPVTCLTFRTDGPPVLVSGSQSGHLALWDLEARKLAAQMRLAHVPTSQGFGAGVTGARCLPGEPLLVTSSPDNTLKQWIFDMSDGGGRLLRIKEGHAAPPTRIRFYGSLGNNILSSGEDSSLRSFSTITDVLDKSFGIASYNRKLSKKHKRLANSVKMRPIIDFTSETTREKEWDNICCVHRKTTIVTTWSFGQQKMGNLKLRHPRFREDSTLSSSEATVVCLSVCGNYVLIGYDSGHVHRFNVQSGIHRGTYSAVKGSGAPAHPGRIIRGICTDGLNQLAVTGDNRGGVKFWHFSELTQLGRMSLESEISSMELHRDSGLMAVAAADFVLFIMDILSRKVVRRFNGHRHQISDLCFSADSRWLLTASMDSTVKVWDIPTGHLVDDFCFDSPVTSLSLSPRGDFLATAHSGDLGIYLWTNQTLYSHVSLKPLAANHQPTKVQMPMTTLCGHDREDGVETVENSMDYEEDNDDDNVYASPEQLSSDLITLANLPESKWRNLLNLDVIRARNKPKKSDRLVEQKAAPFFLPTVTSGPNATRFDVTTKVSGQEEDVKETTKETVPLTFTTFGRSLMDSPEDDFSTSLNLLKDLGPSGLELEIRCLSGFPELLSNFLRLIGWTLTTRKNFEAGQAYLGLFLKIHAEEILDAEEVVDQLKSLIQPELKVLGELRSALDASAGLVAFYRNTIT